jgi:integrase
MPERAVAALRTRRRQQAQERLLAGSRWQETGLVFTTRKGTPFWPDTVDRAMRKQLASAGLPPITVRGLRHGFSSISAKQGVHPKTTMQAMGHTTMRTTFIYTHVDEDLLRDAADRMDEILQGPGEDRLQDPPEDARQALPEVDSGHQHYESSRDDEDDTPRQTAQ